MLQHAGSGFHFLEALKVLHLDVKRIRGQLESDSLEVLKLMCQTIEQSQSEAKCGPFGSLPNLKTVELKAPLNTRMVSTWISLYLLLPKIQLGGVMSWTWLLMAELPTGNCRLNIRNFTVFSLHTCIHDKF